MSTGAIIALISLVVAISSGFAALSLYIRYRQEGSFRRTFKELNFHAKLINEAMTHVSECLNRLKVSTETNQTQIERILKESSIDSEVAEKIMSNYSELAKLTNKPFLELAMFSKDNDSKLSASKHLAQNLGDIDTFLFFDLIITHETDKNIKNLLKGSRKDLKRRLKNK